MHQNEINKLKGEQTQREVQLQQKLNLLENDLCTLKQNNNGVMSTSLEERQLNMP